MGWDGKGRGAHQELGIIHAPLARQDHSPHPPSQQHPCHHLHQDHFFPNDRACICAGDCTNTWPSETRVLVSKSWMELPWKEKVCFNYTGRLGREGKVAQADYKYLKRWQTISIAHFWAQHQKVRWIRKIISGWKKTFSWGGKRTTTHPLKLTAFERSLYSGKGKAGFSLAGKKGSGNGASCPYPAKLLPIQQTVHTDPGMLLPSKLRKEHFPWLTEQFSLKASTQHTLLTPWQPWQCSKCLCKQWGTENFPWEEHLD